MSRYFSVFQVYKVITDDDCQGLRRALFLLGARIHTIKVWCDLTPMLYAARLKHCEQAEILYDDMVRYVDDFDPLRNEEDSISPMMDRSMTFLRELLAHTNSCRGVIRKVLRSVYPKEAEAVLTMLVKAEAIDLLQEVLDSVKETQDKKGLYTKNIVHKSLVLRKKNVFLRFGDMNPEEEKKLSPVKRMEIALLKADAKKAAEILDSGRNNSDDKIYCMQAKQRYWEWFDSMIMLDDTRVLSVIIDLFLQNEKGNEVFLHRVLRYAVRNAGVREACSVLYELIRVSPFRITQEEGLQYYYDFLKIGKIQSADHVKHLVDFSEQKWKDELCKKFLENGLNDLPSDVQPKILIEVIDTVKSLMLDLPEPEMQWLKYVREFAKTRRRPDLVKHVDTFGIDYAEEDVLETNEIRGPNLHTSDRKMVQTIPSLLAHYLGPFETTEFNHDKVKLHRLNPNDEFWKLVADCSIETGKEIIFDNNRYLESVCCQNISCEEDEQELFEKRTEAKRKESLSLQKQCRRLIRSKIIQKHTVVGVRRNNRRPAPKFCDFNKVFDDILSLYVNGYLRESLVDYLLYRKREIEGQDALHYRLVSVFGQRA